MDIVGDGSGKNTQSVIIIYREVRNSSVICLKRRSVAGSLDVGIRGNFQKQSAAVFNFDSGCSCSIVNIEIPAGFDCCSGNVPSVINVGFSIGFYCCSGGSCTSENCKIPSGLYSGIDCCS